MKVLLFIKCFFFFFWFSCLNNTLSRKEISKKKKTRKFTTLFNLNVRSRKSFDAFSDRYNWLPSRTITVLCLPSLKIWALYLQLYTGVRQTVYPYKNHKSVDMSRTKVTSPIKKIQQGSNQYLSDLNISH